MISITLLQMKGSFKINSMKTSLNLNLLEYAWSAVIKLHGGQTLTIWWTAWQPHVGRQDVAEVISVSSDYPPFKIK